MPSFSKLRLTGFKSFVDPTELVIEQGLTGIIGPNGCGKSNLVEALKWVMGETSAKQMRGSAMDDVIFGGSSNRPARNVAEVVLHLNNQDREAPAHFNDSDELEISRRIEREQGSNYRVNGKDVRAKDVHLLFADMASGARSTALVSQGRIGALINAKPIARRTLLEEAAGITGLHSRRHEAELRLRGAETNLERLDDIMVTMEAQLQNLKKQSRQATRYRNLSEHIRKAEATLFYLRWIAALSELELDREKLKEAQAQVAELTGRASNVATRQTEAAEVLPALRQEEAACAAELQRLTHARDALDEEERRIESARIDNETRLEQVNADIEREKTLAHDALRACETLEAERKDVAHACEGEEEAENKARQELDGANSRVSELETRHHALTEKVAADEARRSALQRSENELNARIERLETRLREINTGLAELQQNAPDAALLPQAQTTLEESEGALEQARERVEVAEHERTAKEQSLVQADSAHNDARLALSKLEAEEQTLSGLLESPEMDMWPPLIDAVTFEPGYEAALAAALGEDLSSAADEAAPSHWRTLSPFDSVTPLPEGAEPLANVVRGPAALTRRLSQIGVVADNEQGKRLSGQLIQGQRLVTREGALWRWDGYTVSAGATTSAAAKLEQHARLKAVREEEKSAAERVRQAEQAAESVRNATEAARQNERDARNALGNCDQALGNARNALAQLKEQLAEHASKTNALNDTHRTIAHDLEEAQTARASVQSDLQELPDTETAREEVSRLRSELGEHRATQIELQSAYNALKRAAEDRRKRLSDIETETHNWQARGEGAQNRISALQERAQDIQTELERLAALPEEIHKKRDALMELVGESETKRKEAADNLATAENHLAEINRELREAESALALGREGMVRAEGAVEQGRLACQSIADRVSDGLECKTDELMELAGLQEGDALPDLESSERKVTRLHRERDTMGPVNLRAEQEANEMGEQIEGLQTERQDLIDAIEKLRRGIAELNREGRERLLASYKEVDRHFQELFVRLFGGGHAHLALTESDDPLEAGLEIMASPPGKRMQVLSLLSGGEQALTALALLFAVFLTNPAPVCVLDEVDAPLDDANVDRFCTLLEEMMEGTGTRFLVITHHRMTMARMQRLFGVTMAERGVSQLVSVDLAEAEKIRKTA